MPYLDLSDFRSGLDSRKYKLSLPAGTLTALVNAHITAGGEIEKRKAMIPFNLPPGTFGAEADDEGILVFGSRDINWSVASLQRIDGFVFAVINTGPSGYLPSVGDSITLTGAEDSSYDGTFTLTSGGNVLEWVQAGGNSTSSGGTVSDNLFNAPAIFQQLIHPDGVTQMTSVIYSTVFGANTFVIAEFADGNSFFYYAGTLINDFQAGLVWSGSSTSFDVLSILAGIINSTTTVNGLPVKNYPYVATIPPLPASLSFSISGGTAFAAAIAAFGTLAIPSSNNPAAGDLVVLGSTTYRFVSTLSGSSQNDVLRGGNASVSASHLYHAILCDTGAGSIYNASTVANPVAAASALNTTSSPYGFLAAAIVAGTSGNSIASTINTAGASWTSGTTLSGGVDAVAAAGQILSVWYNFPSVVQLTPYLGTNSALIVQSPIAFVSTSTALAAAVATAIGNATDGYEGGPGTNLGFTATNAGAEVLVTPPVAVENYDSLSVYVDQYLTIVINVIPNEILLTSVPTPTSSSPFSVTPALSSATATESTALLNVGSPIVPGTFAAGNFTISACNISTQGSAVLSNNGSNFGAGDTITIGATIYTFVTKLSGAAVNSVLLGTNAQASLANLISALLALTTSGSGSGKQWAAGTAPNPDVTPGAMITGTGGLLGTYYFTVTAILGGVIGNAVALSLSAASSSWLQSAGGSAATNLVNGSDSNQVSQITVGTTNILSAEVPSSSNSPVTLANDICTAINRNTANSGFSASNVNGTVTITSTTSGVTPNGQVVTIAVAGAVCIDQAEFLVSGTGNISGIAVAGGPSNLLSATQTFQDGSHPTETLIQFCSRVADNINSQTTAGLNTGYVAAFLPNSSILYISRATASGTDADSINLTITSTLTITAITIAMQATASPAVAIIPNSTVGLHGGFEPSIPVLVSILGGSAPYKYQWQMVSSTLGASSGVSASTPTKSSTSFILNLTGFFPGKAFTEVWICQVTDSSGTPVTVNSSQILLSYTPKK